MSVSWMALETFEPDVYVMMVWGKVPYDAVRAKALATPYYDDCFKNGSHCLAYFGSVFAFGENYVLLINVEKESIDVLKKIVKRHKVYAFNLPFYLSGCRFITEENIGEHILMRNIEIYTRHVLLQGTICYGCFRTQPTTKPPFNILTTKCHILCPNCTKCYHHQHGLEL